MTKPFRTDFPNIGMADAFLKNHIPLADGRRFFLSLSNVYAIFFYKFFPEFIRKIIYFLWIIFFYIKQFCASRYNLIQLIYIYQTLEKADIEQCPVTDSVRFIAITFYQTVVRIDFICCRIMPE